MIEVDHLTKVYNGRKAVDQISFTVQKGEILGLLGPNGAGKTTTMRILTCYMPATDGTARVAGFDVFEESLEVRRRIGYLPETPPLYPEMAVESYLHFVAKIKGAPPSQRKAMVDDAMQKCAIGDVRHRIISKLSKGYKQRVGLAQALLKNPEVLILDEPTIGLDPVARRAVWERLLELRRRSGMTMLLTTHDMEEADVLCDRLAIMHQGALAVAGRPADLKAALGEDATLEDVFIQAVGGAIEEGGTYRDVRRLRSTVRRLG